MTPPLRLLSAALLTIPGIAAAQGRPAATGASSPAWESSASLYGFAVPGGTSYLLPIVASDRGALHLEGRYNYESLGSASLFAGWTLEGGGRLHVAATPMFGFVFGDLRGAVPGLELTLSISHLELYTEAEYVFDLSGRAGDYFYVWSEFTYGLSPAWRAGIAGQRLRTSASGLGIDRGLLVAWQPGAWGASATVFDPFTTDVFYMGSISLSF